MAARNSPVVMQSGFPSSTVETGSPVRRSYTRNTRMRGSLSRGGRTNIHPHAGLSRLESVLLVKDANQLRRGEDVTLHGLLQRGLGRLTQIRQHEVQCIQFVEVPMLTNRRAGATV